jgi:hypothetical protein
MLIAVCPSRTARENKRLRAEQIEEKIPNRFGKNRNDNKSDGNDDGKTSNRLFFSSSLLFSPLFFSSPEREQPGTFLLHSHVLAGNTLKGQLGLLVGKKEGEEGHHPEDKGKQKAPTN